jgi:hypothetical protein
MTYLRPSYVSALTRTSFAFVRQQPHACIAVAVQSNYTSRRLIATTSVRDTVEKPGRLRLDLHQQRQQQIASYRSYATLLRELRLLGLGLWGRRLRLVLLVCCDYVKGHGGWQN